VILPLVQPTEASPARTAAKRTKDADDLADATARWHSEHGALPDIRKPPTGTRARMMLTAYRLADNPEHFSAAVRLAAAEDWYIDHRFGVETFCRHAAEWLDKAVPSAPVPAWQPPLDGPPADDATVAAFRQRWGEPPESELLTPDPEGQEKMAAVKESILRAWDMSHG
jgi:hypothetical protein